MIIDTKLNPKWNQDFQAYCFTIGRFTYTIFKRKDKTKYIPIIWVSSIQWPNGSVERGFKLKRDAMEFAQYHHDSVTLTALSGNLLNPHLR